MLCCQNPLGWARQLALLSAAVVLSACGGDYGGGSAAGDSAGSSRGAGGGQFANSEQFFAERVQSRMSFCRTCHIPGGVADTAEGERFMLSPALAGGLPPTDDYLKLNAAWIALGRGVDGNKLLVEPSTASEPHSGGKPWPVGSDAYQDMKILLQCWDNPVGCAALLGNVGGGGVPLPEFPLLGSARGGGTWSNFCEGDGTAANPRKDDDAVLPIDPRTLVVPGVNKDKAVAFNAYWKSCDNSVQRPTTCGEMRAQAVLGKFVGHGQGEIGTPLSFAGGNQNPGGLSAELYNQLWDSAWGLSARPDNFDELVAERYGSPRSIGRNPYPLTGEDPNTSNGGSGQLPMAFTQIRTPDGRWTGEIGQKVCIFCHNGQLGTTADGPGMGAQLGGAGSIGDFSVAGSDFSKVQGGGFSADTAVSAITISTNRGSGAIDFFQLAFILFSNGDPALLLNDKIVLSQAIGNIKSPPWWNLAYRPQKFHGAILPTDSSRIDLAAYYDLFKGLSGGGAEALAWMDAHAGPFQTWAETLASPRYPGDVNTDLAEQGAVLFHSKDLWAANLNNPVTRPDQGNGSCASCHGAYSPRYANDPAYLDSPKLAGIAAYTVPTSIAGTDPAYSEAMQSLRNFDGSISPAIMNQAVIYCGVGNAGYTANHTPIMLAPPLWGIWAAAPYFHNGSVPNIWGVLDPAHERPRIWRRVSTPARADQAGKVVMGYDTNLQRAYDHEKLGWKYDELSCGAPGSQPVLACNPINPDAPSPVQQLLGEIYKLVGLTWNLPRPEGLTMTQQDIENRKIYNTNLYSQGNQGHAFTSVLNDQERRALIEYLKTL
jgi:mono/diheme cytochrome c family protein